MLHNILHILSLLMSVDGSGLLLLYRPRDISTACAFSSRLRYDISFGMGMSDTITVVFRTLNEIDYECVVEIVTDIDEAIIIVVIKFPTTIAINCLANRDAFTVMKKNLCLRLCDLVEERDVTSPYYIITVKGRIRFRFLSNSSINSDINAEMYQVTATSARRMPLKGCVNKNETTCSIKGEDFCFTTGVVCDGIKNCGVTDWCVKFDERKSGCDLPVEYLSYAPVIAVVAAIICALVAGGHVLMRCLPPLAKSFFIFNANEDNRLCIDPLFKSPDEAPCDIEKAKRTSLIPIFSSSSSSISESGDTEQDDKKARGTHSIVSMPRKSTNISEKSQPVPERKTTIKSMTAKIQDKFRSVTGRGKNITEFSSEPVPEPTEA